MKQIEQVRKKEGLKVVIYDLNKINESLEQSRQEKDEEKSRQKNTLTIFIRLMELNKKLELIHLNFSNNVQLNKQIKNSFVIK